MTQQAAEPMLITKWHFAVHAKLDLDFGCFLAIQFSHSPLLHWIYLFWFLLCHILKFNCSKMGPHFDMVYGYYRGNFEGRFLILILVVLLGQVFWNCIFSSKKFPVLFFHVKFCSFCKKSWLRIVYLSKNPRQEKVGLPEIF